MSKASSGIFVYIGVVVCGMETEEYNIKYIINGFLTITIIKSRQDLLENNFYTYMTRQKLVHIQKTTGRQFKLLLFLCIKTFLVVFQRIFYRCPIKKSRVVTIHTKVNMCVDHVPHFLKDCQSLTVLIKKALSQVSVPFLKYTKLYELYERICTLKRQIKRCQVM